MSKYFRITAYNEKKNYTFIADSYGHFEKLWQFSAYLITKGMRIIAVNTEGKFEFGNIPKVDPDPKHIIIRACTTGKANFKSNTIKVSGKEYTALD